MDSSALVSSDPETTAAGRRIRCVSDRDRAPSVIARLVYACIPGVGIFISLGINTRQNEPTTFQTVQAIIMR